MPGYLLYKKYDWSSTALLVPQVWRKFITGTNFQRSCTSVILGKSFAIVSGYLADSSKCLETFEGTLKSLDTCLHVLKHKYKVETIVVGADAQCQLPMNNHGVGPRCFALPFRNSGRGRSRSLHELCARFGLTALNTFLSGGVTEDLPMNMAGNDDDDEYGEDAANQLCAESWTRTNGTVKSQIDYVWATPGIRFHGGVREKLSGDHRPLTYNLEMENYGEGTFCCWRAPSELEDKKRQNSLNGWKPLDPENFDIASARIADSLLPGGIHHFPDPEKLLLKKGAKRKDDGRAITSSTPCLGSVAECIVASV